MYIGDIKFDYSGLCDYKSYSPSCKAEFRVYGSFEEMADLQRELDRLKNRNAWMSYGFSDCFTTAKLLGCSTSVKIPPIKKVIFHNPATIVYWNDNSKTVVKCKDGETFDKEKGLALCISKKLLEDKFHSEFKKWVTPDSEDN